MSLYHLFQVLNFFMVFFLRLFTQPSLSLPQTSNLSCRCNGSIGLAGNSHLGIVQWFIAAQQPPSLKAIAPWEACGDLYREQFVRGGAWDNGLFDFIIEHVIRGKRGVEDFKEMYRRSNTMNPYWEDKRAEIEKIKIPTYVVASYSSFVHTMGSIRGWMEVSTLR